VSEWLVACNMQRNAIHSLQIDVKRRYTTMNETKTEQVNIRLQPSLKAIAEKAAAAENRTLTNLIETALSAYLRAGGYLKKAKVGK
jgi:hypothetical protein